MSFLFCYYCTMNWFFSEKTHVTHWATYVNKYFKEFVFNHIATKYPRANSKGTKGNPNNSEPLTISNINSKVNGIDSEQECLEKHLLEHVCGINIVEF